MGITHEWNGTVLTITSDSGTSSADLKGEKGDTGIRGPQGIKGSTGAINTSVLNDYATEEYVNVKIAEAQIPEKEVDLSSFYTKSETKELLTTASNALKGAASGEIISMKDVSPITHTLDVKVRVKNLISPDFTADKSANGITFTDNKDGTITVNGTATSDVYYTPKFVSNAIVLEIGKDYVFSGVPQGGGISTYYMTLSSVDNSHYATDLGTGGKFTAKKDKYNLMIYVVKGTTLDNVIFKPQLELGTVATPYTPYISNLQDVELNRTGKNLIPYPYVDKSKTIKGVTFTDNGDGSITVEGMPTGNAFFSLQWGAKYGDISIWEKKDAPSTNGSYTASKRVRYDKNNGAVTLEFYADDGFSGYEVFYPQLEFGTTATEYEPYKEPTTYPINSDGIVENIKSIYPTTTLLADTLGVVIDVNYNRDLNKAFEELIQAIISLGGNI